MKPFIYLAKNLAKDESDSYRILVHHIAVGGDTNRGTPPWPVSHRPLLAVIRNL
jgi:hypothetical protein